MKELLLIEVSGIIVPGNKEWSGTALACFSQAVTRRFTVTGHRRSLPPDLLPF